MNNSLVITLLLVIILLLIVFIIALFFIFLRTHPPAIQGPANANTLKKEESIEEKFYCINHGENPSIGSCLICEDVFCEECLINHENLSFCREHFKIFANNKWKQITDVRATPDSPEEGLYIYHFKRRLWKERRVPSFVLTHYKINLEHDYIESYIQLNTIDGESQSLMEELSLLSKK